MMRARRRRPAACRRRPPPCARPPARRRKFPAAPCRPGAPHLRPALPDAPEPAGPGTGRRAAGACRQYAAGTGLRAPAHGRVYGAVIAAGPSERRAACAQGPHPAVEGGREGREEKGGHRSRAAPGRDTAAAAPPLGRGRGGGGEEGGMAGWLDGCWLDGWMACPRPARPATCVPLRTAALGYRGGGTAPNANGGGWVGGARGDRSP